MSNLNEEQLGILVAGAAITIWVVTKLIPYILMLLLLLVFPGTAITFIKVFIGWILFNFLVGIAKR